MSQNQNFPYLHSLFKHTKTVNSDDWPIYKNINLVIKKNAISSIILKYKANDLRLPGYDLA